MQMKTNQIVPSIGEADLMESVAPNPRTARSSAEAMKEIGEQKDDRSAMQDMIQKRQGGGDICCAMFGLEMQRLAQDPQNVATPFARRQIKLDLIGKKQQGHFVTAACRGNRQGAGYFCGELSFRSEHRSELSRSG